MIRDWYGVLLGSQSFLVKTPENGACQAGSLQVLDAGVELAGEGYMILGTDNDRVLFPGEERMFSFLLIPKYFGGFAETGNYIGQKPELRLHWL